jgi:hypothetical protein
MNKIYALIIFLDCSEFKQKVAAEDGRIALMLN